MFWNDSAKPQYVIIFEWSLWNSSAVYNAISLVLAAALVIWFVGIEISLGFSVIFHGMMHYEKGIRK